MKMRRSIRLQDYDYRQPGLYYVTICTQNKICYFGELSGPGEPVDRAGIIVFSVWDSLPSRFPTIQTDAFVVMPNHVHGIIVMESVPDVAAPEPNTTGAINRAATGVWTPPRKPTSLGEVVRQFKGSTTYQIRATGMRNFGWQPNYYEHIIRTESALNEIRQYIDNNPFSWANDENNPITS